jgi:hypothetical protein
MDRIQIGLPVDVMEEIQEIAFTEHRSPRQQIEYYVMLAVRAAKKSKHREPVAAGAPHE